MRSLAMTAIAVWLTTMGVSGAAMAAEEDDTGTIPIKTFEDILEEQKAKGRDKGRLGLHLGLMGPSSLIDLQVSYGAHEIVDVVLSVGFTAGGQERVGNSFIGGPTEHSAFTAALRGRLVPWAWPQGKSTHGPTFELGVGMSGFSFSAEGGGNVEGKYTYSAGGNFPAVIAGVGYTWRMKAGFRANFSAGWTQYFGEITLPKVATTGTVHDKDLSAIQAALDEEATKVDDSWPYAELSLGWVF